MQRIMVIGCNSLELTPIGIRVLHRSRTVPIAWRDVTAAALAGQDRQMMQMFEAMAGPAARLRLAGIRGPALQGAGVFGDLTRKMLELRETHDALLIVHRAGIVHALIEQSGPERDVLLAGLRANLGGRWLGEDFTSQQLEQRFGSKSSESTLRGCGCATVLVGGLALLVIVSLLVVAIPGATMSAFVEALLHGDWKAALILGPALVVIVLVYLGVKKVSGYLTTIIRGRLR